MKVFAGCYVAFFLFVFNTNAQPDYNHYHEQVLTAESLIGSEQFKDALETYQGLFDQYDFIFLRDFQIAAQLAYHLGYEEQAQQYLRKGMASGWKMKSIQKNRFLKKFKTHWRPLKEEYKELNQAYEAGVDESVRKQVKNMFSRDQWKAFGALFTFGSDGQDRYAEKRFAPQNEQQVREFSDILEEHGYPGEQLVGNDYWMSTILSHHNSISRAYNQRDTMYQYLRPKLLKARQLGEMSAFEFALIDEWYRSSIDDPDKPTYGILSPPVETELAATNALRKTIFLRSIETHNQLVEIENSTGMNFYLEGHPWEAGKKEIRP